jgi:integrase
MSIHRRSRKSGVVYRVQYRDSQGHQRSRTFSLKRDADAYEAKVKLSKRQGELAALDNGKQLFSSFVQDWRLLYGDVQLAPKTRMVYDDLLARFLVPRIGGVPLRELTTDRLQRLSAEMLADGTPEATLRKTLVLLQGVLERAVEWGRIGSNPARYVRKPRQVTQRLVEPPSPAQIEAMRAHLIAKKRTRDATLISVLAYAGLRPGEALALRWGDIRNNTIRVDKALSLGEERSTKTRKNRTVRLLKQPATDLAKWKLACGRPNEEALVFPTSSGAAWSDVDYRNWRRRHFKTTADSLGLVGARPYDLRHSFASLLLAEQSNPAEVAAQLGHSLQVLFSTYAHVIEDLRGTGRVDAEDEIRSARKSAKKPGVAQKLPKGRKAVENPTSHAADSA